MNSFISWIGGKKLLRNKIIEQFPDEKSFERYIEVFGGAGWVLFAKERHAKMEVFNDINSDLINLYRVVKYHPEALQKELDWMFVSREQFSACISQLKAEGMTDIQKAARFYCIIKNSFGANQRSFSLSPRNMQETISYLSQVSKRLNKVVIENQDFEKIIKTYDRPKSLFYLDPPYYEAEKYYPDRFQPEDHVRLKEALERIQGKFVLSYNDCPEIKELYKGYNILETDRSSNLTAKNKPERYKELIIKNY